MTTQTLFKVTVLVFVLISGAFLPQARAASDRIEATDLISGDKVSFAIHSPKEKVIVFLSAVCPCSASHEKILEQLHQDFPEVQFVGIHSNADENDKITKEHFAKAGLTFPVIQDVKSNWANLLGALKTPHAFVVNTKGEIVYKGGVSDSHDAKNARKFFLRDALNDLKKGEGPKVAEARTLGCVIAR
jgi:hypothetical protein